MVFRYFLIATLFCISQADRDDKKWVWNNNNRNGDGRSYSSGLSQQNSEGRYDVFEPNEYEPAAPTQYYPNNEYPPLNQGPIGPSRPPIGGSGFVQRPQIGSGFVQRPQIGSQFGQRPQIGSGFVPTTGGPGFVAPTRPGGLYGGSTYHPTYANQKPYYPSPTPEENPGILTGPVPSWVKEGPIKDFDKCKCAAKFNCNSPGISYGHCDVGKQYCCYSSKKDYGGPVPSNPSYSIENGILVGPGGPRDPIRGVNDYGKPGLESGYYGSASEQNEYSAANGILVGPTAFGLGRSAKSTQKSDVAR
ncbi:unnamed protein product [Ceutorhynchus assimilis]|uniref:Uncharacterized protein n=1 Tax=Ceutorhynchus assimilis TaxID=467358 RepID=A0A9P0DMT1_9CUCU|nr:unnamed protein product [Ceutorhynchus assimilis]